MEISAVLHWGRVECEDLDAADLMAAHEHAIEIAKAMRGG